MNTPSMQIAGRARRIAGSALFALFVALPLVAAAADFTFPPAPDHYVTDNAGALSDRTRVSLESRLRAYEAATGHQVIVWIGQTTGDVPLETWTGETADHWKIGRKKYDDGAVLFVFMADRKVRIEVGYGLESKLTDADAFRIIQTDILPRMRAGDVDAAVEAGVAAMIVTITPSVVNMTPPPAASAPGNEISVNPLWFFFGPILFIIIVQIIRRIYYGYLVMHEGRPEAQAQMRRSQWYGGPFIGGFGGGGFGGGGYGGGGGGFSSGGGSFGGGGASGGW